MLDAASARRDNDAMDPSQAARWSRRTMLACGLACVACSARGRTSRGPIRRVVSLTPNATEIVFALGEGARVVGVSRYDDHPPEVARLTRVGGMIDPSLEAIIALRPDALIGAQGPVDRAVLSRLESLGVRTFFPPVESLAQIRSAIVSFAQLLAVPDARARSVVDDIDARVGAVRARVASLPRPRVLMVLGQRPLVVAGPGSFLDELLTLAGGQNAVTSGPRWPTLSLEVVLALAPDIVLDLTAMEGHGLLAESWAGYRTVPAVRDGRVVRVDDPVVERPGPRVGIALEQVARAVHPAVSAREARARGAAPT